jgi:hypothetical protein
MSPKPVQIPASVLRSSLVPQLLKALPKDWHGTTFDNSNLLSREGFAPRLLKLLDEKKQGAIISTGDLEALGNAEDYRKLSSLGWALHKTKL